MKLQKLSANMFAMSEKLNEDEHRIDIVATSGETVAACLLSHSKRSIHVDINIKALKHSTSISKIADMLCVSAVFLKNDNIKVKNLYGYEVTVQHKEM